jgi:putative two-component system response regulator
MWNDESVRLEILGMLASAVEHHDGEPSGHGSRTAEIAEAIAQAYGLPRSRIELIRRATPLHDIGKVSVPAEIIDKEGRLSPEEFETMKTHTSVGAKLLSGGRSPLFRLAERLALTHHERWDGSGYHGMAGLRIPVASRIVAVADVFDALTRDRVYKSAWDEGDAVKEIVANAGTQFDPDVVEAFLVAFERRTVPRPPLENRRA